MPSLIDLTGRRFGRLLVLRKATPKNKRTHWHVKCDCGIEKSVGAQNLTAQQLDKRIVSCGCYRLEVVRKADADCRNPIYIMYWQAKKRAKLKGLEFSIDPTDISIPEVCPLLGTPLIRNVGVLGPSSPSLDRIDSKLGYVKGNVWVISYRANAIKSDSTIEEMRTILREWEKKCAI